MSEVFNSFVLDAIDRATTYSSDYVDPSTLKVIVIDGETRHMTIPEGENLFGARGDKNVERKYFQCPKIVGDNIDLSQHLIYANYVFTDIDNTTNLPETNIGMYHCEDVAVEGDNITFSWLLSGNVLHNPGFIAFKVCAKEKESDPTTVFNTTPAIGVVLYTIPDGSEIIPEEYPDIITQLLADMDATKEEVADQIARIDAIKDQIEGAVEGTLINDNTESNIFTYSSQKINVELRKKATYYDSVASMKADSSLKDGSVAVTLGYYSENDGGGATYLIRAKQSGDEDDGGSIHELNGGQLVAELIIEEYVTPEMFGAVGNGIHDDTEAIEKTLSSNKKIVMKSGATYKICRTIIPKLSTLNIDGQGSTIIADNSFTYTENLCYGFIQLQNYETNLKEFVIRNLNINITTDGILYGDRVLGDERSCPIFRLYYVETIIIDNCHWFITSNSGNRAILWTDGNCTNSTYITNSEFINKCAGNAGGVIAIRMKNDEKDVFSFMANCNLITDSCDELYSINNIGASNLYSIIDSCIMVNHGGFIKNTEKETIIVATNHEGTGDLRLCVNATKIEYDGPETAQLLGAFKLSSYNNAKQNVAFNSCDILNPYGHSVEGALGNSGNSKYMSVSFRECNIVGGKNLLLDIIDNIGSVTLDNCDIIGESYISYFYPLDYTNHFILKNSRVTLKNPKGILHVHYKKRHIIGIYQNLYSGDYPSISFEFDEEDPNAPDVDMQIIDNNVFLKQ